MAQDRITIRIVPTPATQDISPDDIARLGRLTKLTSDRVKDRISKGKSIVIITTDHPKVQDVVKLIKSMGFSVSTGRALTQRQSSGDSRRSSKPRVLEGDEWSVGEIIENLYEVVDIKQGGMGAVYVVRHRRWNSMMAIKSLLKRLRENEEDRALFVKEAETWIDIGFHPNIAACFYVRNIADSPRIFIEYVDGGALNEWLNRRQRVGWGLILDLMVQVSDGLHHAHSKGLVHRDVKPGNCMMTHDGVLKVTDFGLTKRRQLASGASPADPRGVDRVVLERESITAAGMGTPGYMAPEMWIPYAEVGPAADIYAFGVMFFELCCGRKPFIIKPGERRDKLALAHVKKPPPRPSSIRADLPESIEEIVLKCLNKSPRDRYASFREIRGALASAYEDILKRPFTREPPDEVTLLSDALNNRAVSLMDLNHREEAVVALRKALEADPHHPEAVYNMGIIEWQDSGDPNREIVVKMEEVVKTPEYVGRGSELLARCLLSLGDADRAVKACELAFSAENGTEGWLKPYAIALIGVGKTKEAIGHLKKYLERFPTDDEAMGWFIAALAEQGEDREARSWVSLIPRGSEIFGSSVEEIRNAFVFSGLAEHLSFEGHGGWVTCLAHFPTSRQLVSGSRDRTIRVWDSLTAEEKKSIPVIGEPPARLCVSPDERLVATVGPGAGIPVRILDLESGRFVGNLQAQEGLVTDVAFSLDGKHILTVVEKGFARLWQADGFRAASSFKIPAHSAATIISADPRKPEVVLAGLDRIIRRVLPGDMSTQVFQRGHNDLVTGLKAWAGGRRLVSWGRDKVMLVWDGEAGKIQTRFKAHQEQVTEAAPNPTRDLIASYDVKSGIKVWDASQGLVGRTFSCGESEVHSLAFSPDGHTLFAGGRDMMVRAWDVRGRPIVAGFALAKIRPVKKQMKSDRKFKAMIEASSKAIKRGAYAVAYTLLRDAQALTGYERSEAALEILWRMKEHGSRVRLHGGWNRKSLETPSAVMDVRFSPSAITFLTAHADHSIRMWSTKTGEFLKALSGHTNLVACLDLSVNGREAISGSDDRTVRLWDLNTGRNVSTLKGHSQSVSCVAYSQDGTLAVSGSWDSTIKVWRLPEGSVLRALKGHEDRVTAALFVHDSEHVVSAGFEGLVRMWEVSSGRLLRELKGHKASVTCMSVSPCGDLLLTGSSDGTVRIWDVHTGACLSAAEISGSGVRAVACSPDEKFFVTGTEDAVVGLWSISAGECQREFRGHSRELTSVQFSSNQRFVLSASSDGLVMLWELDWDWDFGGRKGFK
jgi:WD40 repeat protein/serine/threonine protein kinase